MRALNCAGVDEVPPFNSSLIGTLVVNEGFKNTSLFRPLSQSSFMKYVVPKDDSGMPLSYINTRAVHAFQDIDGKFYLFAGWSWCGARNNTVKIFDRRITRSPSFVGGETTFHDSKG